MTGYSDLKDYIEGLLRSGESSDIEFKSAQRGFPKSFWASYSAFANTNGGAIVLGVSEPKAGKWVVEGLADYQIVEYKKTFWNDVHNPNHISANVSKENDVVESSHEGKNVLVFIVPRADRASKPVYLTRNPFDNTYRRRNEGDYKCSKTEVKRMLADADDAHPADSRILYGFTIEDLDQASLRQYRQMMYAAKPDHTWLTYDDMTFLEKLGGYRRDRLTGEEGLTCAALWMFGKTSSITDVHCSPNFFLDYQEKLSADSSVRWTDRIYPDGTWEANLFQFYLKVYPKLIAFLPKPFQVNRDVRQDETPATIAVREALVNVLVHASYIEEGGVLISNEINQVTFSNPGSLLISQEQYYKGGLSVCRNKSLQQMFMMIGRAEKAGSGVDKIMDGWAKINYMKPSVKEQVFPDRVTLLLPKISLLSPKTKEQLKHVFGDTIVNVEKNKLVALSRCLEEGEISNDQLQYALEDVHSTDITKMLQELARDRYITPYGKGRGTKYKINVNYQTDTLFADEEFFEQDCQQAMLNFDEATSGANIDSSNSNIDSSVANIDSSSANIDSSNSNMDSSNEVVVSNAGLSFSSRVSLGDWAILLEDVCVDFMSAVEIAERVGRNPYYLKSHVIPALVKQGKLEPRYPNVPRHPYQSYRIKMLDPDNN